MDELVHQGLVRYTGIANGAAWRVVEAEWVARAGGHQRFVSVQNRYNLLERGAEDDVLPVCERYGIGLVPYYPLANGLLTGKYRRNQPMPSGTRLANEPARADAVMTADAMHRVEALALVADAIGVGLVEVALGSALARPAVSSVIAGASTPEQVVANAAAGGWQPTPDDLAAIDLASPHVPYGQVLNGVLVPT